MRKQTEKEAEKYLKAKRHVKNKTTEIFLFDVKQMSSIGEANFLKLINYYEYFTYGSNPKTIRL
jgi:hypothetical protein